MEQDDDYINKLLRGLSSENRHLEFKPGFLWDRPENLYQKEKLIRAILALINTPTGGHVILGIEEQQNKVPVVKGVEDGVIKSFAAQEIIKREIQKYSSTPIDIGFVWGIFRDAGKEFQLIAVRVSEFNEIPTICRVEGSWSDNRGKKLIYKGDISSRLKKDICSDRITETEFKELVQISLNKEKEYISSFIPQICPLGHKAGGNAANIPDVYEAQGKELL